MNSIEKKDKVQKAAITAWKKADKKGTCEIITGLGKTFIGLHALYTMPKDGKTHLFLAEAKDREKDLMDDIKKYNKIFNKNVLKDYKLEFYCYQTVYKWKDKEFGLIIADEIHDSLTPSYGKFYKYNNYDALIGLSATVNLSTRYELKSGRIITKGDIIKKFAPVCFKYGLEKAKDEGTTRNLTIYVIVHKLDDKNKYVVGGSKKKRFYQTEEAAYNYWDKRHKQTFFLPDDTKEERDQKQALIRTTARKRSDILYNLKSKVYGVKELLAHLNSKTIIFGNSIDTLLKITPNVVSSRNSDAENLRIRNAFDKGLINRIGSFKKLKQGANLQGLDNAILMSYYSTNLDLIQRIGRLRDNGELGKIFIFVTQSTQEEIWYNKMIEEVKDFNIVYCSDINICVNILKNQ